MSEQLIQLGAGLSPPRQRVARHGRVMRSAVASAIVLATSVAAYPLLPRFYTSPASILFSSMDQDGTTRWDQTARDALDDNAIETKIDILKSEPLQMAVIRDNNLLADPEFNSVLAPSWLRRNLESQTWLEPWLPPRLSEISAVRSRLLKGIQITRERKSYLIRVSYTTRRPETSAALTNSLVTAFLADQLERRRAAQERILASLRERLKTLDAEYHQREQAEHQFVVSSGLDHVGEHAAWLKQLEELGRDAEAMSRKSVEASNRAVMLADAGAHASVSDTTDAMSSAMLQRLRERLVELTAGSGTQGVPIGANATTLAALRAGIDSETHRLVRAAQNEAALAQKAQQQMQNEIVRINGVLVSWEANERTRADLHRAVTTSLDALKIANDRYAREFERKETLQPGAELVSIAVAPDRPSFPNPIMYAAGTLGLIVLLNGWLFLSNIRRFVRYAR